jgi:hypothetical protein
MKPQNFIKSGENVEKNVYKKLYPKHLWLVTMGKLQISSLICWWRFFKVTFWQFFNSFEINVKLSFFDAMTKV